MFAIRAHMFSHILLACSIFIFCASAHGEGDGASSVSTPSTEKQVIYVESKAPYIDENSIDRGVLGCGLSEREINVLIEAGAKRGYKIVKDDAAVAAGKGRILKISIMDAVSQGNAFIGHNKVVKIRGSLTENGKEIGIFSGTRSSHGGFGAGFKGSCSVLERCTDALANDIAAWLDKPSEKRIGE